MSNRTFLKKERWYSKTMDYLGKKVLQKFDDMLVNLLGLRVDYSNLPDDVVFQIFKRAQVDLLFIVEGFRRGSDIEVFK